ncbi:cupin domain-containing protein [Spirabiliibacterium falconis]|uniref:hypothetical protein n=1 Tax=Spirabiliibacterium falconis TaxID=572023 RepID=UPI001AAD8700|nr:hypothetical protein [Spirabiliibacterium falconis]MBE2894895.1 hypothetical protein [Spirabiliibacterium falconis]
MKLSQQQANERLIRKQDYSACTEAFLDCRLPGSVPKENYSLIGPGVTQSKSQVINLKEPHGFNIGAAAMPHGITNNLHIHFTAEVFMCLRGQWKFRWGAKGEQGEFIANKFDILSVPTWIFRGFTNVGDDNGWLFTCLGGDDTGGVIWSPDIMEAANKTGLYLSETNELIDIKNGDKLPEGVSYIKPFPKTEVSKLRKFSFEEMSSYIVTKNERVFSHNALLDSILEGHKSEIAPVIGFGITQDRNQQPKIVNPHGFTIEWLRIKPKQKVGPFKIEPKMVLILMSGNAHLTFNIDEPTAHVSMSEEDTYSIPQNVWRTIENISEDHDAEFIVITTGDSRKRPEFSPSIVQSAQRSGWETDANGYIVPTGLIINNHLLKG